LRFDSVDVWKSPIKIGNVPQILVMADQDEGAGEDRAPCICVYCRKRDTGDQILPALEPEEHSIPGHDPAQCRQD
jgi:hypothetical protein